MRCNKPTIALHFGSIASDTQMFLAGRRTAKWALAYVSVNNFGRLFFLSGKRVEKIRAKLGPFLCLNHDDCPVKEGRLNRCENLKSYEL
jgi:hypothetical protein